MSKYIFNQNKQNTITLENNINILPFETNV
jgi:hypothetical protein